jgi:hypothetical protein
MVQLPIKGWKRTTPLKPGAQSLSPIVEILAPSKSGTHIHHKLPLSSTKEVIKDIAKGYPVL